MKQVEAAAELQRAREQARRVTNPTAGVKLRETATNHQ
jgi:hypothetical protein